MRVILCNSFRDENACSATYINSSTVYYPEPTNDFVMTVYKSPGQTQEFHPSNAMCWRSFSLIGTKFRFGDFMEEI